MRSAIFHIGFGNTLEKIHTFMIKIPEKNSALALPKQISTILKQRILDGSYLPGQRLAAIRKLAGEFNVCTVTVSRALNLLEEEKLVVRVPVKGVFVAEQILIKERPLAACFAFPEKELASRDGEPENDALNAELYRGLLAGARQENIRLQFTYFEDDPSPEELKRQLETIKKFDFIIFTSSQLLRLQQQIAGRLPAFRLCSHLPEPDMPQGMNPVDYDRLDAREKLFELFRQSSCCSAAAITNGRNHHKSRAADFLKRVAESSGITPAEGCWVVDAHNAEVRIHQLQILLRSRKAQFIFCDFTDAVRDIYEAAYNENLIIGKDIMVAGIASGITVGNLFPRYTFFKIPRFEQGEELMHAASRSIRNGEPVHLEPLKVRLIPGQSVKTQPLVTI